jgi:hypothetical protein
VDKSEAVDVSVGATLLAIGGGAIFTLLIYAAGAKDAQTWGAAWFIVMFGLASVCTAGGIYVLAALYLPLPLPKTRSVQEAEPDLRIESISPISVYQTIGGMKTGETQVLIRLGFNNRGRGDVSNASVNVLVPDGVVTALFRSDRHGNKIDQGVIAKTSESLLASRKGEDPIGSMHWNQQGLSFPGRTSIVMEFRASVPVPLPFPVLCRVVSADLQHELQKLAMVDPDDAPGSADCR